ncbi:MAG: hypothetical protein V4736_04075 [Bdellovibrionota bacterium]
MKYSALVLAILVNFQGFNVFAAAAFSVSNRDEGSLLKIEPIVGYETVYRELPLPHTSTRTIYGGRVTLGEDWLAGELEYTRGSDTENYTVAPEVIKNEDEKLKLGVRSIYRFNEYMFTTGRIGGQAHKNKKDSTSGGVTTSSETTRYSPYAGVSLGIRFAKVLTLSAGTTVIFNDATDMSKNDYQHVVSLGIGYYAK